MLRFLGRRGIARSHELEGRGISRSQLSRLCDRGLIERVGRGLYTLPEAVLTERHSLAEAGQRVPRGVVCLLSALRFHELTTQSPFEVWMAIDRKAWRPRGGHPRLRFVYVAPSALQEGVEEHDVGGAKVRVYSAAKTVADCFKFRSKIGLDVAVEALRDYRRLHPKQMEAVWKFAQQNRITRILRPYLEAIG